MSLSVPHLIVPFASPISDTGRAAAAKLQLPTLRALLARLGEAQRDEADVWSLSPPHERVLGRALGWQREDGCLPLAALQVALETNLQTNLQANLQAASDSPELGLEVGQRPWGLLSPVHWHVGTDQVSLLDPAQLMLDERASKAIFADIAPLFTSEGFALHWATPLRWYASHPSLAEQPCASLDRVIGRNVDRFLKQTGLIRRLQSEVQMLLYNHPVNDAREASGLLSVNSFWLSGCGVLPAATLAQAQAQAQAQARAQTADTTPVPWPTVDERLRSHALGENWPAWVKAWHSLDEGPLRELLAQAEQGQPVQLSLCGERAALTLSAAPQGLLQRLLQRLTASFNAPAVWSTLEPL